MSIQLVGDPGDSPGVVEPQDVDFALFLYALPDSLDGRIDVDQHHVAALGEGPGVEAVKLKRAANRMKERRRFSPPAGGAGARGTVDGGTFDMSFSSAWDRSAGLTRCPLFLAGMSRVSRTSGGQTPLIL